tara:strand:- start:124 stop:327 length:204 start_codon:yes stop_codon:yes gene_type:complete
MTTYSDITMNKEPKELTRDNYTHTKRILFWFKGKIAKSAHERIQHYKNLQDADKARLLMSEWIMETP